MILIVVGIVALILIGAVIGLIVWAVSGDKKSLETDWTCIDTVGSTPVRRNKDGDIECMSKNTKNCLWPGECISKLETPAGEIQPLTCGAGHQTQWDITGYEKKDGSPNPEHWCSKGKVYFETLVAE